MLLARQAAAAGPFAEEQNVVAPAGFRHLNGFRIGLHEIGVSLIGIGRCGLFKCYRIAEADGAVDLDGGRIVLDEMIVKTNRVQAARALEGARLHRRLLCFHGAGVDADFGKPAFLFCVLQIVIGKGTKDVQVGGIEVITRMLRFVEQQGVYIPGAGVDAVFADRLVELYPELGVLPFCKQLESLFAVGPDLHEGQYGEHGREDIAQQKMSD